VAGSCAFCGVVGGSVAAHEVYRDDRVVAFLDRAPLFIGHVLVVPTTHHVTLADLPAGELGHYFGRVQLMSVVVPRATGSAGSFVALNNTVSQSVPHLHTHVVPRNRRDGLRGFFWPRTRYRDEDHMAEVAATLRAAVTEAG
jgi:histidine triad (HIT) family protein